MLQIKLQKQPVGSPGQGHTQSPGFYENKNNRELDISKIHQK